VYGWTDQRWTLARITTLIGRLFHARYTLRGTSYLLHLYRVQPADAGTARRRAGRGGHRRVAHRELGEGSRIAGATGAWVCSEDEAAHTRRPPKARTWARCGQTPVVAVSGKGSEWVSVAGLICLRPATRGRLFYRVRVHRGRKGERRSLSEADYASLVTAAHNQLHAPIVLVWDNLNTHVSAVMREFIDAHRQWLTVVRLPDYAPELNPVEGVWSHMKRGLGNLGPVRPRPTCRHREEEAQGNAEYLLLLHFRRSPGVPGCDPPRS
jgi:hypothetical protein